MEFDARQRISVVPFGQALFSTGENFSSGIVDASLILSVVYAFEFVAINAGTITITLMEADDLAWTSGIGLVPAAHVVGATTANTTFTTANDGQTHLIASIGKKLAQRCVVTSNGSFNGEVNPTQIIMARRSIGDNPIA